MYKFLALYNYVGYSGFHLLPPHGSGAIVSNRMAGRLEHDFVKDELPTTTAQPPNKTFCIICLLVLGWMNMSNDLAQLLAMTETQLNDMADDAVPESLRGRTSA